MPTLAQHRQCQHAGCGASVLPPARFCARHRQGEPQTSRSVYHKAQHRRWRKLVLARDAICVDCGEALATDADHKVPLSKGGSWALSNGQGLCHRCHSVKTARERGLPVASQPAAHETPSASDPDHLPSHLPTPRGGLEVESRHPTNR